jgi:ABC-2 type transport system ATP-binding protein
MNSNQVARGPAIDVRDLRKFYGQLEAVDGVSFEVARGEVFCLLGPNGAGKTSVVEILEGYRTRTDGSALVLGIDPSTGARELHEQVGIVLQQCGIQPDLSVAELLEMYGRYYVRRRPVDELLAGGADGETGCSRQEALRRPAPPARPGAGTRRRSGARLPGRAHDGL